MAKIKELSEADKKSKIPVPTGGTPTPPPDYTAAVTAVMGQLNVAGAVTAPTRAAVETSLKAMVPTSDNAENAQQALDKKLSSSAYKTAEAERQRAVSARLVQEATLREELNGIIPTAIAEQTHKRYEEITRLQEVANKKNKENAKNSAVAIVGDAMSKDWIENNLDKRERIIHGKQIQADMLHLIYARDAEYGVKQLMLRALSEKNGWDVDPATGVRNPDFWKTANLDTLPADQKAALDLAFAGNKNYVQTLMNTYYEAKNNYKMGGTNLRESDAVGVKFKKHELALLYQKFGAQLEAGLANSTQGQEALRMMQEKGLDKPDKRMKALMIALAVAGVTGLAVTSGAGGALLGVAGAAASNGVDVSKLLALGSTAAAGAGAYGAYKMSQ
jgi:hypothetical protein